MKTASLKAKGRELQQYVCRKLCELFNMPYQPDGDIVSRPMGQGGVDIVLSLAARKHLPFSIECKNTQTLNLMKTIKQAESNCYSDTDWLIVWKKTGKTAEERVKPVVFMDFETFLKILKKEGI